MHRLVNENRSVISSLCRRYDVRRLDVFGSAAREGAFREDASDVDFLVEFNPASALSPLDSFFGLQAELTRLLKRPVDLVEAGAVKNPYVLDSIQRSREVVYAA